MKVLHINQSDIAGGAAIAGYRLHQGLLSQGIDSRLLVGIVKTSSVRVAPVPRKHRIEKLLWRLIKPTGLHNINHISTFDILKHTFYKEADVLNFHNLHTGYFNYLAIPSLTKNKPAVLTLHDMWSLTGGCVYSYDCDRWKTGCGKCHCLNHKGDLQKSNTRIEWKLKNWVYSRSNLTIVTNSIWLAEQAKQSMLNKFPIYFIPFGLDTEAYQPLDPEQCRYLLGIPPGKKVIMFGAEGLTNPRKGGDIIIEALSILPASLKDESWLLTIGEGGETMAESTGIATLNLGYVSSDRLKAIAYSAADLFVLPTRAEAFGLVLQESLTCGTPLVSFRVGGVPDIVRPGTTGYLAEPGDIKDLCNGIVQLLEDRKLRDRLSQNCRAIAVEEYTLELQAQRYIDLYRNILPN